VNSLQVKAELTVIRYDPRLINPRDPWHNHALTTRSSAVAEKPRDASCHWIFR